MKVFVLHGAIDDYSYLITFLQCSTNNKAMAATTLFDYLSETYSLSLTIRTNKGGESTLIYKKDRI